MTTKSRRASKASTRSTGSRTAHKPLRPFTIDHFRRYGSLLVYDDGDSKPPEDWQLAYAEDVFEGRPENWLVVPEGNGKTTFTSILVTYGADFSPSPWIPVGAASSKQARILHNQAAGFIRRTPGLLKRFRVYDGYLKIVSLANGGSGIEIFAASPDTGDGVIPFPYAVIDEGHRQDMELYRLWKGKLRKRGAQILMLSTAGEPDTPFEKARDSIRRKSGERKRTKAFIRVATARTVMHDYMVVSDEACTDMRAVKDANPLSTITEESLGEDYESETLDLGDWKRLKCNRPTRSARNAITDAEWDRIETDAEWVEGQDIDLGLDVAWKWDTTAFVPRWDDPQLRAKAEALMRKRAEEAARRRKKPGEQPPKTIIGHGLLGPAVILEPPRDGSMLHPDELKHAFLQIAERNNPQTVVMDTSKAEDIAAWIEEQGVTVIERGNTNLPAVQDYDAFTEGLRNETLQHTGDEGLRGHVLNAIARRLPGGDHRFDRPSPSRRSAREQDRRVIDALTAAAMVVELSTRDVKRESTYESRGLVTA